MGYKSTGTQNGQNCSVGATKQFPCDEQPIITAYSTLQQMASTIDGALKFYYQPTNGELTTIFQRVALDLTMVRLVDDSTTVARRLSGFFFCAPPCGARSCVSP